MIQNLFIKFIIDIMTLNKEVQAYYSSWNPSDEYTKIVYDSVTCIAYHNIKPRSNGTLYKDANYNPDPVITYAHSQNVKIVLSFMDYSQAETDSLLSSPIARTNFVNNIYNEVVAHNFDGIDNDLESTTRNPTNKANMTALQNELSQKFWSNNPNYRLSIAIQAYYPNADQLFDVPVLQNYSNYIMIMGYDWYGGWSSTAGPNSPHLLDSGIGNFDTIKHYEDLMNKNKLLFGVPWYGKEFSTTGNGRLSPLSNTTVTSILYKDYASYINNYNPIFDNVWKTPWYARLSGGQWYQGHYDDLQSLGQKYDVVNSEGLGGIGIWQVGYGRDRIELYDLIKSKFGSIVCNNPTCTFAIQ